MKVRIGFEALVAMALVWVLVAPGSYGGFYGLLGSYTPYLVLNLLLQFLLILATIRSVFFASVFLLEFVHFEVSNLIDGPIFRLAHLRGARRERHFFLSRRALGMLISLHKGNLKATEWLSNILAPFVPWGSLRALATAMLILSYLRRSAISGIFSDAARGAAGAYVSSHLELIISASAFLLSLAPYVVLVVLLFSSQGRRIRFRNNSQIVTDATHQLAQLELRTTDVVDASYTARSHLMSSRNIRAIWTIDVATNGRIRWSDGLPVTDRGSGTTMRNDSVFVQVDQPEDERVRQELDRTVKRVNRTLSTIEGRGLSPICEQATVPIRRHLRMLHIDFRRRLKRSRTQGTAPTGALAHFRTMVTEITGGAGKELTDQLGFELSLYADYLNEYSDKDSELAESDFLRASRSSHIDDLKDLADDDAAGHALFDFLQQVENHIRQYCETVDHYLIDDGYREWTLWGVRNFLYLHVLGGQMDTIADRLH